MLKYFIEIFNRKYVFLLYCLQVFFSCKYFGCNRYDMHLMSFQTYIDLSSTIINTFICITVCTKCFKMKKNFSCFFCCHVMYFFSSFKKLGLNQMMQTLHFLHSDNRMPLDDLEMGITFSIQVMRYCNG